MIDVPIQCEITTIKILQTKNEEPKIVVPNFRVNFIILKTNLRPVFFCISAAQFTLLQKIIHKMNGNISRHIMFLCRNYR